MKSATGFNDSGVLGLGSKDKPSSGRWVYNTKDGRKRVMMVYLADHGADVNDQAYLGYFADENKASNGCNFAISIGGDEVTIQTVGLKDKEEAKIRKIPLSKFMDILDTLLL
jgi:hypothetical protein